MMKLAWSYSNNFLLKFVGGNALQCFLVFFATLLLYKLLKQNFKKVPPGPIGIPLLGYLPFLGKEPHKTLLDLSKKYGDMMSVRMGPKLTIVLNEYNIMKEVLCHPAALNRAPNLFDHIPKLGFITANGEEWIDQRRFSLHSMRDLGLGKGHWEDLVLEEVTDFLEDLSSFQGKPVDISHRLNSAISNNVLSLLIGRRLHKREEKEKVNLIVNYSDVSFTYMGPSLVTSLVPGLRRVFEILRVAGYDRASRIITSFRNLVLEEILKHKSDPDSKGSADFIDLYLEEKEKKEQQDTKSYFSDENLEGNMKILFLGASDTIFSSLGWIFRLMAEFPDIQKKVQQELDDVIGSEGRAFYEERFKIPYTFAVMMESQRYSSIVPLSTTRSAAYDFEVQGYTIPKGSEIFGNLWAIHNDPNYWEEPEKFIPERFLSESGQLILNKPSYAPFSIGRRNCPGETVAWMEILVFFTSIMQKFSITTAAGVKPQFEIVNGLVAHLKPQPLCFVDRTKSAS